MPQKPEQKKLLSYLVVAILVVAVAIALWVFRPTNSTISQSNLLPTPTLIPTVGYEPFVGTPVLPTIAVATTGVNATAAPTPTPAPTPTAIANPVALLPNLSDHFGIILTGLDNVPDVKSSLDRVFSLTNAKWWYQYGVQLYPDEPNTNQVFMVRIDKSGEDGSDYQQWLSFLSAKGNTLHNSYWLMGNEPNVPGQDNAAPDVFAKSLHDLTAKIKAVDPQAFIVGPNVLNWNYVCDGCPGYTMGLTWTQQLMQTYRNLYNAPLPFDAYSLHTYSLDWNKLPLVNPDRDVAQIQGLRTFLDANADTKAKPIWLTEFGVIWGYDGLSWKKDANGNWRALPSGQLRTDLITNYLNTDLNWFVANATAMHLDHWFLYTSYGLPETYTDTFSGISLLDSNTPQANLTNYGQLYVKAMRGGS